MRFRLLPPELFGSGLTAQATPEQINLDLINAIRDTSNLLN